MRKLILLTTALSLQACSHDAFVKNDAHDKSEIEVKTVSHTDVAPANYIDSTVINFEFDSYKINTSQKERLQRIISKLSSTDTNYLIRVTGYTDDKGTKEYNEDLAMKRSSIIKDVLIRNKVPAEYIATDAKGKCCYLNDNASEDDRYQNRRAEIIFMNEFFVLDYKTNNIGDVMQELSLHHNDKQFIVFKNLRTDKDKQSSLASQTADTLKANFLSMEKIDTANFGFNDDQIVLAIAGSHPVLIDELPESEVYGNSPQEIIKHNGFYVMKDKKARLKPVMRSESELAEIMTKHKDSASTQQVDSGVKSKHEIEAEKIKLNLGFNIDDEILRMADEVN